MKIREESPHHSKIKSRKNEQVRRAGAWRDSTRRRACRCFERSGRRGPDSDDTAPAVERAVYFGRRRVAYFVALRFDFMILDSVDADGLKRAVAHMKGDLDDLNAAPVERVHQCGAEVQAGSRRGNRSALPREYRLIAIAIVSAILAFDVRRQRHVADRVNRLLDRYPVFCP